MAQPIVDGIKEEMSSKVNVIQLNLLSQTGREAARTFGISLVPATLLFNAEGNIVLRKVGMPDKESISAAIDGCASA